SAADHLVGGGYFLEHRRVVGLPGDGGVDLPFAEGGRKLELLADVGDGHVGVLDVQEGEGHLEVIVMALTCGVHNAPVPHSISRLPNRSKCTGSMLPAGS